MPHLVLAICIALALLMAFAEARWITARIASGNTAKLPHRTLLTLRVAAVGIYTAFAAADIWQAVLLFALITGTCAPVHSVGLNLFRKLPWYYLGPLRRTKGDSLIDTFFIDLASVTRQDMPGAVIYRVARPWLPMTYTLTAYTALATIAHILWSAGH